MNQTHNTVIESIGIYLPPESVSTDEILQGCKNPVHFPLEKISGIRKRHMAGIHEFSIDLARKAVADCLANSRYKPDEIDILICCNISRYDGPERVTFEPSTATTLRRHFGFTHSISFDITNACAGMFTGIYIVDGLIRTGAVRRGLVVSGEYITHLTKTAQREIEGFMDTRLACLTLGDAGAAVLLEKAADNRTGFQQISLQTLGRYSAYCIAKPSDQGGWIMYTDSVKLTDAAIKSGAEESLNVLQQNGWSPDHFRFLVMHQTSKMTLNSARNEINKLMKDTILQDSNTINNLEQRGNTASTSHVVAIADQIRNNTIKSGDKIVFSISASGLTVGTALYVFDDLPDRLRNAESKINKRIGQSPVKHRDPDMHPGLPGIRVSSVGITPHNKNGTADSMNLLYQAASDCLRKSAYGVNEIGMLIYCGVYRNEYIMEPAYAALLAGKLNMNAALPAAQNNKTLAFDLFNGSSGFLNACYIAQQLITAGNCRTVMIVASETENNRARFPDELLGVSETASAVILEAHPEEGRGFSRFRFSYYTEWLDAYNTYCSTGEGTPCLHVEKVTDIEEKYIACIVPCVDEYLLQEGVERKEIDLVFPPQVSSGFINRLSEKLRISPEKFIDVVGEGPDLFTSSIPGGLNHAFEKGLTKPGDKALMITAGSGLQVGCVLYHF